MYPRHLSSVETLPEDIFFLILANLAKTDINHFMAVNTFFYEFILCYLKSENLSTWRNVNPSQIISSHEIKLPALLYNFFPLWDGIAFGLNEQYIETASKHKEDRHNKFLPYPEWENSQQIVFFSSDTNQPHLLCGHTGSILHIIQINANTIASLSKNQMIYLWDIHTYQPKNIIPVDTMKTPMFLLSSNHDELICLDKEGSAWFFDIHTGAVINTMSLLSPQQTVGQYRLLHNKLVIEFLGKGFHQSFMVWDFIKNEILKKFSASDIINNIYQQMPTNIHGPHLTTLQGMKLIDYNHEIAVIKQHDILGFVDIQDLKNPRLIYWSQENVFSCDTKYLFLSKDLIILDPKASGWKALSHYNFNEKQFDSVCLNIQGPCDSSLKNTVFTILENGNIIAFDKINKCSSQWSRDTQNYLPDFELKFPEYMSAEEPIHALYNLPSPHILGCNNEGRCLIWNNDGSLLFNNLLVNLEPNISNLLVEDFKCKSISMNGNVYFEWRKNVARGRWTHTDHYEGKQIRFGFFTSKKLIANEEQKNYRVTAKK
jgi:hypothetical protein